jgi:predicted GNAT family N-acyltransferase
MMAYRVDGESELRRCLEIRRIVFVEEQGVPKNLEMDELEPECTHFLAWSDLSLSDDPHKLERAVGTARLWVEPGGVAKAQRVAVLAGARGLGVGRMLMSALEEETRAQGISTLVLGAQISAQPFYETIGYLAYGDEFDDAGIPHRMMRRNLA